MKFKDILLEVNRRKKKIRFGKLKYNDILSDGIKRDNGVKYIVYENEGPYARFSYDVMYNVEKSVKKILKDNRIDDIYINEGVSERSVSTYLEFYYEGEEDYAEFKLRFSDHDDKYGSDYTVRIDDNRYLEWKDDTVLYVELDYMERLIKEGVDVIVEWIEKEVLDKG